MILSHVHKFIYFKAYKTASTSVELFFGSRICNPDLDIIGYRGKSPIPEGTKWYNHMQPQEIKDNMQDDETFNDYFKFGCVRNPWDRKLSSYFFCIKNPNIYRTAGIPKTFEEYCMYSQRRHFSFRTLYDFYDIKNIKTDYFIRFEKLREGIEHVCNVLNLEDEQADLRYLQHKKKTNHKHYTEYYTDEMRDKVAEDHKDDIEYFNYTFGD